MAHQKVLKIVRDCCGSEMAALFSLLLKQKTEKADAIIFLQGDRLDRAKTVVSLYKKGWAGKVLIAGNNELIGRKKRNEENDVYLDEIKNYLLRNSIPEKEITVDDKSLNTLEQAQNTIKKAKEKKWKSIIVVTSPYHLLRAFLTFLRQAREMKWKGIIYMKGADKLSWFLPPSGRKKQAFEMLAKEIEKMKTYKKDIATIKQGLDYIKQLKPL